MSFINLSRELFETTTLNVKPQIEFTSSSVGEIPATGSMYVAPIRSKCIKNLASDNITRRNLNKDNQAFSEDDFKTLEILGTALKKARKNAAFYSTTGIDISSQMEDYLSSSSESPKDIRFSKFLDIFRFDPPIKFNLNHVVKRNLNNILYPYHQHRYPESGKHYTNFNCLNFFTASHVPSDSCLIYPNKNDVYTPKKGFTLDFWINPRYDNFEAGTEFTAGTIFHMSSSMAVSLVSGSGTDGFGRVNDYKLLLQLSQSADINPSKIDLKNPNVLSKGNLIYTSSLTLKKNNWHHVSLLWDPDVNNSSGEIRIDNDGDNFSFNIPSSSVTTFNNDAIFIGNYFDGSPSESQKFFNKTVAPLQGLTQLTALTSEPTQQRERLANPLNAEIHDIKLFNRALSSGEIENLTSAGVNQTIQQKDGCDISTRSLYDDLLFFVPPFFYPETRTREVLVTPFQTITSKTDDPINVAYSFGVGGKLINLENFVREFKQGEYPRLQSLTGSTIDYTIQDITADQYVYDFNTGSLVKRNFTILPCDNGLFFPDYYPIKISNQSTSSNYAKSGNESDYSRISLDDLIPSSSLFKGLVFQGGSIFDKIVGASPENPGIAPGSVMTIAQRTRDRSSNETTIFDISNLYYGNKITEESLLMTDDNLTGSKSRIKIKIRDNGAGSLYRADCETKQAKWNNVGDIFYHEGVIVMKTPHLPYFCKDKTKISFKGDHNIHTLIMNIPCDKGRIDSSSNKSFVSNPPTNAAFDSELSTVYISSVNIHDDNFNIIMKANFSQPIPKTEEDEFIIRLKQDF